VLPYFRDSVVGIPTRYGLDGPGFKLVATRYSGPIQTGPETHNEYRVSFLGVRWSGRGVDHPPHSSAGVKYRRCPTSNSPLVLLGMSRDSLHLYCPFFRYMSIPPTNINEI
jgi:hypothetical protein